LGAFLGIGGQLLQSGLCLGNISTHWQSFTFFEHLLEVLQLLLRLLQIGLDGQQPFLLCQRLVQFSDGLIKPAGVCIQGDFQTIFEFGCDLVDLGFRVGQGLFDLLARCYCGLGCLFVRLSLSVQ